MLPNIQEFLIKNRDLKYRDFQIGLLPTIDSSRVIGVRMPILRSFAKRFKKDANIEPFLQSLPHESYEEDNLHAFIIGEITDYDRCIDEINRFLPFVDNWATCDSLRPKCFKKHLSELWHEIKYWLSSPHEYTVRFGIEMLMVYYLDSSFDQTYLERVARIRSDRYYVNMMIAWYFATALAKQWDATIPYIEQDRLDNWTHRKAIQKAVESYRITNIQKTYLKTLKQRRL